MNNNSIVKLENVSKIYKQGGYEVKALDEVTLQINAGDFLSLVGPSGSGKTTALNLIGGLDVPTAGEIFFEEKLLKNMSFTALSHLRRDRIGFIFQAYNLIPVLTALENTEFILELQNVDKKEAKSRAQLILKEVGLEGFEDRRPDELSGGQQQRVAIARAIVSNPAIVLADEPTANLDSKTAEALLDLMAGLNEEKNITFLFSTHDEKVMRRARKIIKLQDGRLNENG